MKKFIFISALLLSAASVFSQEALKTVEDEYYEYMALTGQTERPYLGYKTFSDSVWTLDENHLWKNNRLSTSLTLWQPQQKNNFFFNGVNQNLTLKLINPSFFTSWNSALPTGQNDGALWQGRGINLDFTTGVRAEFYGLELTLKPEITWSQNLPFEFLSGVYDSEYSYFWKGIDKVQRYGDSSFFTYDWGDTEIRYTFYNFTVGFGWQNPWLGSSYLNPMLGSSNAPGYPKFDIGLRKTLITIPWINWNLGYIEGRIWCGKLTESDYFDNDDTNNERMINALSAGFSPSFVPGFTIGANRVFITRWKPENFSYFFQTFLPGSTNNSGDNDEDQKISIYANWTFPKAGFEMYGEYGVDDFCQNLDTDLFHTGIYTAGIKQDIPLPWENVKSQLIFEYNNFEMSQDFQLQWPYMGYYGHGAVAQGYTQKGQILGAGTGYFGNSQFIKYQVYYPEGTTSFYFQRYCNDNNYVYSKAVNATASQLTKDWYTNFETHFAWCLESTYYVTAGLQLTGNFTYSYVLDRNYQNTGYDEVFSNFYLSFKIKYIF